MYKSSLQDWRDRGDKADVSKVFYKEIILRQGLNGLLVEESFEEVLNSEQSPRVVKRQGVQRG